MTAPDTWGAREVRAEDAFVVAAMADWLRESAEPARAGVDLSAAPEVRQFSGGVSNLTYLLRFPDGDLILRRPPKGTHHKGAHDMSREHRIQNELGPAERLDREAREARRLPPRRRLYPDG